MNIANAGFSIGLLENIFPIPPPLPFANALEKAAIICGGNMFGGILFMKFDPGPIDEKPPPPFESDGVINGGRALNIPGAGVWTVPMLEAWSTGPMEARMAAGATIGFDPILSQECGGGGAETGGTLQLSLADAFQLEFGIIVPE